MAPTWLQRKTPEQVKTEIDGRKTAMVESLENLINRKVGLLQELIDDRDKATGDKKDALSQVVEQQTGEKDVTDVHGHLKKAIADIQAAEEKLNGISPSRSGTALAALSSAGKDHYDEAKRKLDALKAKHPVAASVYELRKQKTSIDGIDTSSDPFNAKAANAMLDTAKKTGREHYVHEIDTISTDPIDSAKTTFSDNTGICSQLDTLKGQVETINRHYENVQRLKMKIRCCDDDSFSKAYKADYTNEITKLNAAIDGAAQTLETMSQGDPSTSDRIAAKTDGFDKMCAELGELQSRINDRMEEFAKESQTTAPKIKEPTTANSTKLQAKPTSGDGKRYTIKGYNQDIKIRSFGLLEWGSESFSKHDLSNDDGAPLSLTGDQIRACIAKFNEKHKGKGDAHPPIKLDKNGDIDCHSPQRKQELLNLFKAEQLKTPEKAAQLTTADPDKEAAITTAEPAEADGEPKDENGEEAANGDDLDINSLFDPASVPASLQ